MEGSITIKQNNLTSLSEVRILYFLTVFAMVLFFVSDGISKVLFTYNFDFHRVSLIARILLEGIFLLYIISVYTPTRGSVLVIILSLLIIFFVSQIVLTEAVRGSFFENLIIYNKYIFLFILYAALYKLKSDRSILDRSISVLENIFTVNSVAVLLGPITGFEFLKSYINADYRHGYMGFIVAQNEATLFYFIGVSLIYYRRYILDITNYKFFIILFAAMLLGTKGIYIFLFLLFLYHIVFQRGIISKAFLLIVIAVLLIKLYQFAVTDEGRQYFVYFYNENLTRNFVSMLLSGRDILLETDFFAQIGSWSTINYFVGGQNVLKNSTELDLFDLFLFFGFLGSLIYLTAKFITVFRFKKTKFHLFFITCYFILAFFGGHFFSSAVNGIYLCLLCIYFDAQSKDYYRWKDTQSI